MLLERLLANLTLDVDAFATCHVAPSWRLRLPSLNWVTLHYVAEGEGQAVDGDGTRRSLQSGALAVVPPHMLHSLQCGAAPFAEAVAGQAKPRRHGLPAHLAGPEDEKGLVVACGKLGVTYGGTLGLFDQLDEILVLDFSRDAAMKASFEAMADEVTSRRPGSVAMTTSLMRQCLIRVLRTLCRQDTCHISWLQALDDPSMAPVIEAMLSSPEQPHTVASLADRAYLSRSAFARRFRENFGVPPLEYLRGVRMRHAAMLLRKSPPLPIATVAARSGFSSRSQFSRTFRRHFGVPPTRFRA